MHFSCTSKIRDTRVKIQRLIKNEISSNRCTGKTSAGVLEKRSREGQSILYTYKRLGIACFTEKVKSSMKDVFASKPKCENAQLCCLIANATSEGLKMLKLYAVVQTEPG